MPANVGDDGNLIRAIGLMTIHAAHAEDVLDQCLGIASAVHGWKRLGGTRISVSCRRNHLEKFVKRFPADVDAVKWVWSFLRRLKLCMCQRNRITHSLISYDPRSGSDKIQEREGERVLSTITSAELYTLVNDLRDCHRAGLLAKNEIAYRWPEASVPYERIRPNP